MASFVDDLKPGGAVKFADGGLMGLTGQDRWPILGTKGEEMTLASLVFNAIAKGCSIKTRMVLIRIFKTRRASCVPFLQRFRLGCCISGPRFYPGTADAHENGRK